MTPERWHQVKIVFHQLLEVTPEERSSFLDRACSADPSLRQEVESLLFSEDEARSGFLEPGSTCATLRKGTKLGDYEVQSLLSAGGMGVVYRAIRADGLYKQQVALKIVRADLGKEFTSTRFRNERQILASLDHPNIAKILDGGTTPDGLPYFVMELIDGLPITAYCDQHKLTIDARLQLFRTVCSAVHHAHQHLVIHRDLKPGNILITSEGVPKLLDFGIAKILDPKLRVENATMTAGGPWLMTPEYASPEQVRGATVSTASDIYSLGVLLYELLSGHRPYRGNPSSWLDVGRQVCEEDPEKPSTAFLRVEQASGHVDGEDAITLGIVSRARNTGAAELRRRLRGELDSIVLKALRKEPQQRYISAEQLSADIAKHLRHEPIIAATGSSAYRLRKYLRRHRLGVAAGGSLLAVLIAFAVVQAVQLRRITRERDRANRIADFMSSMFKVSDPSESRGNRVTAREILDKAAKDMETGLARDPELQAQMMSVIGNVYDNLGLYSSAAPLLTRAGEIRRHLFGPEHPETLSSMGDLAWVLYEQGRYQDAERLERATLQIRLRALGAEHPDTLKAMNGLGVILSAEAKYPEAEKLFRESLAIKRRVLGPENAATIVTMGNLASTLDEEWNLPEAEKLQRDTLELKRRILGPQHPSTFGSMNAVAWDLYKEGRLAEAEKWLRDTLEGEQEVLGPEHPETLWTMTALGKTLSLQGRYAAAEKFCRQTLNVQRRVLGPDHPDTASSKVCLASIEANTHKRDAALLLLRDSIEHGLRVEEALSLESVPEFNALHDDPRFDALIAYARQHAASLQNLK